MREEYFQLFIDEFGDASKCEPVPKTVIDKYRGKLPDQLLEYWQNEGWCQYADGLFWTVNPEEYDDILHAWLLDTPLESIDNFYVIARSAFGDLYLCGEKSSQSLTILSLAGMISGLGEELKEKTLIEKNKTIRHFFGMSNRDDYDLEDDNKELLFDRAKEKLGPIDKDEMYYFEPAVALGGKKRLENLQKGDMKVHLSILREFSEPQLAISDIDINSLIG